MREVFDPVAGPVALAIGGVLFALFGVWVFRQAAQMDADFKRRFNNENAFGHRTLGAACTVIGVVLAVVGLAGVVAAA